MSLPFRSLLSIRDFKSPLRTHLRIVTEDTPRYLDASLIPTYESRFINLSTQSPLSLPCFPWHYIPKKYALSCEVSVRPKQIVPHHGKRVKFTAVTSPATPRNKGIMKNLTRIKGFDFFRSVRITCEASIKTPIGVAISLIYPTEGWIPFGYFFSFSLFLFSFFLWFFLFFFFRFLSFFSL